MLAGWTIDVETVIIGAFTGLAYAVLGAGIVLVYRATRVVNFAHGEMGALSASVLAVLVVRYDWNFFLAFAVAALMGGAIGALIELGIVRRLFQAPRLILLVATIGVSQLLFVLQLLLPGYQAQEQYPSPIDRQLEIGNVLLRSEHFMVLAFVPALMIGLWYLLTRTPYGIDIRAAAENADRAELVGISTKRVSTLVWILAGVLAAVTVVLINPLRGTILGLPSQALGPALLLRALAAALVGRMVSLPLTLLGGLLIGIVEAVCFVNVSNPGIVDALLLVAVLALVLSRRYVTTGEEATSWSAAPRVRPVPPHLLAVWWVRQMGCLGAGAALVVAVMLPLAFRTSSQIFLFSHVLLYAIVALSVTVLIGWAGQLSLGQFAIAGVGAMVTVALQQYGMSFGFAVGYATIAGVLAAMLIGFPALRVPGLFLAVTTLAFAVAGRNWIFSHELFLGEGNRVARVERGVLFGVDLRSERSYYYVCLAVLIVCVFVVSRMRDSGVGRAIIAVRDNPASAASFTVSPTMAKLTAFAVAGGLAALAGALLAGLRVQFGPGVFGPEESLRVIGMTVIGGLGSIGGSIVGAAYVIGLPALFGHNETIGLLTSGLGLLVLLLYLPGGLAQRADWVRQLLLAVAERRLAAGDEAAPPPRRSALVTRETVARPPGIPALRVADLTVRFNGRDAVRGVSLHAEQGEIVGLIGSNGAGKSTLLNAISGFVPCAAGRIEVFGHDVAPLPPHRRASLGLSRVFQDARLFPDLTVVETVKIALEGHEPTELVPSMLGVAPSRRSERRKAVEAAELVSFLGLGRFGNSFVSELSTGTRRIVELCCLLAHGADLLLLDEPTAGVAQRETEAFGPLIRRVQAELRATIVIIEHDMPLVMALSDRLYCMSAGTTIAEGRPDEVRVDPKVIAAYLGTDERAIARSGALSTNGTSLIAMSRAELLAKAGARGIPGRNRMRKHELISALEGNSQ